MKTIAYEDGGPAASAQRKDAEQPPHGAHDAAALEASPKQSADRMARSARFWDRVAERYSRKPVADEAAYRRKLEITREYFRPDMEVLEFGCGTGSTAILHAPYVKHIRAVDVSSKMLEIARRKADAAGIGNVTFERSDIEDLALPAGSADVVLGLSILHLLKDKQAVIAKVHDMLKPGGVLVTSTACLGDRMAWFKYVAPIGRSLGFMPLVKVFTAEHLKESLTAAGFAIDHYWRPAKSMGVFIVAKKAA